MTNPEITLGEGCVTAEVTAAIGPVVTATAVLEPTVAVVVPSPRPPEVVIEGWNPPVASATVVTPIPSVAGFTFVAQPGALVEASTPCSAEVEIGCVPGPPGPPGPEGPQGPPGSGEGGGTYVHIQAIASAVWSIIHQLGFFPNVTAVDSARSEVVGDLAYVDADQLTLTFSAACAGEAYLS